jgi:hypothetical protein
VRHRRGELAERDQPRRAVRGVAVLGDQRARPALLGHVGQHAKRRPAAVDPAQRMRVQHVPAVLPGVVVFAVDDRRRRDVEQLAEPRVAIQESAAADLLHIDRVRQRLDQGAEQRHPVRVDREHAGENTVFARRPAKLGFAPVVAARAVV